MNWLKQNWMWVLLGALILAVVGLTFYTKVQTDRRDKTEAAAAVLEAQLKELSAAALKEAQRAQVQETRATEEAGKYAASEKKRVALAGRVAQLETLVSAPPADPGDGSPVGDHERDDWRRAVQTRDDLIVALKDERTQANESLATAQRLQDSLRLAVEHYKSAYLTETEATKREREANAQLRLALEAQKGLTRAAYWKGFFHGSMVGGGLGAGGTAFLLRRP